MPRYRFSAPRWTSATEIGKPNTARAPAVAAVRANSGQRTAAGWARLGSATGVAAVGPDARAFAEGVLQILDQGADVVGGAHRTLRLVVPQQHEPGAGHPRHLGSDHTQVAGLT